jgi:hypothetical protein
MNVKLKMVVMPFMAIFINCMLYAQEKECIYEYEKAKDLFSALSDSLKIKYPSSISVFTKPVFGFSIFKNEYLAIYLPRLNNLELAEELANVLYSFGKTENYVNKRIIDKISIYMVLDLQDEEDSLIKKGKDYSKFSSLVQQIAYTDLKSCARYSNSSVCTKLKRRNFIPEIKEEMKKLLASPDRTLNEAKLALQSQKKTYVIEDTTGYYSKKMEYKEIYKKYRTYRDALLKNLPQEKEKNMNLEAWAEKNDSNEFGNRYLIWLKKKNCYENYINKIESWKQAAKREGITLNQWLDKTESETDNGFINNYLTRSINVFSIIEAIGYNNFYELAGNVEELYLTGKIDKDTKEEARLTLARLQYKDYENLVIDSIRKIISLTDRSDYITLLYYFKNLVYINTQESFYAIAPLLLIKNEYNDNMNTVPINARFFVLLKKHIKNFPWDEKAKIKGLKIHGLYNFDDPWDVNNYLPKDFLGRIFQWMIENRGKYEIGSD